MNTIAMNNSKIVYGRNKQAKVGEEIVCATCGKKFIKTHYQQAFCGQKGKKNSKGKRTLCKDQYWNRVRYLNDDITDARRMWANYGTRRNFSGEDIGQD